MQDNLTVVALTGLIFVAAGLVKGVLGMGLPTIAIGFLGLVIAPVEAAAMLVLPSLITNVWQLIAGPNFRALSRRFGTLLLGICAGTPFGVSFITSGSTQIVTAGLGIVLAIYGAFGLSAARLTVVPQSEWWLSPVMGFCTGILMGATGISALPVAPYFTALGLKKDDLIQALGLSFTVSSFALAVGLLLTGQFQMTVAAASLVALIPAFAGMFLGQRLRNKIPQDLFKKCFFGGLLLLGVYMTYRALTLN
ncbi:MAG: hypothetical protein CK528_01290 [Alcaligenaceae bacterium]|nr:MAG: hypothetical protein CK528_01290 [Alcaligenaceae bacterium]